MHKDIDCWPMNEPISERMSCEIVPSRVGRTQSMWVWWIQSVSRYTGKFKPGRGHSATDEGHRTWIRYTLSRWLFFIRNGIDPLYRRQLRTNQIVLFSAGIQQGFLSLHGSKLKSCYIFTTDQPSAAETGPRFGDFEKHGTDEQILNKALVNLQSTAVTVFEAILVMFSLTH